MWIVRLALRRPYTFVVAAILVVLFGAFSILRTPTDIFPNIDIPVVSIIWSYTGLDAQQMSDRIVSPTEKSLTTTVDNIEHVESQSLDGIAVVKVFLQPKASLDLAITQITAISQTQLRNLPTGTTPPLVIAYSASTVPILQLGLSGQNINEQQLNDLGFNFIRARLITVPGAAVPFPYGGKVAQVMIDLDPSKLQARGLSPIDVVNAITAQNLILPSGTSKIGALEYDVSLNGAPATIAELNDLPIKTVGDTTIYVHDVAWVRNGFSPQTNIVRVDGRRAALLGIEKAGNASTLDVVSGIKAKLQQIEPGLPPALQISPLSDQSIFVRASISGVVREALLAACLTALMILAFLGSWRSTVIIAVSIPLSILTSLIVLAALGQTINIMTLGGLALAVGILVDDATVAIENIDRNIQMGKPLEQAILDGSQQIAIPALVSTLCICIVFAPMFFLSGVARYLFVPLAEAVIFAMLASYVLSRSLVPTMAKYLLRGHAEPRVSRNPLVRLQARFEHVFEQLRLRYRGLLASCLDHRRVFLGSVIAFCVASVVAIAPWLGEDFFPQVDAGQIALHVRARTGTRIEETARLCDQIERAIRREIPANELGSIVDNIGLPYSGINLSYSHSAPIGSADADIQVSLAPDHRPTARYVHDLRATLDREFPQTTFSFLPADIVSQILNFGSPAPIDIQVTGADDAGDRQFALELLRKIKHVSGTVDLRLQQPADRQGLNVTVDRSKASELGLTQRDVATNLLTSLSGSSQTAPTFWLNPTNHVSYPIATETPQYRVDSLAGLENVPIAAAGGGAPPQILGNVGTITRSVGAPVVSHYDIQPVIDIYGSVQGRDLGAVAHDIDQIIHDSQKDLPRGSQVVMRGQVETMRSSYTGLFVGLAYDERMVST